MDAEACEGGLRAYLGGGPDDPSDATVEAFGERNPFRNCADGFDGIINAILKVSNDPNEFPSENDPDLDIGASYMGSLVARASLSSQEKTAIRLFIRHARAGHLVHYEDALKAGLAELATKGSSPQDEARVQRETGIQEADAPSLLRPRQAHGAGEGGEGDVIGDGCSARASARVRGCRPVGSPISSGCRLACSPTPCQSIPLAIA